jgi:glutamate synthase domain-containing protein 1
MTDKYSPLSISDFSGGSKGVAPGACGLFAIHGNCQIQSVFEASHVLQYRARNGAGVFLKGFYRDDEHYHFHIMYRDRNKIPDLEDALENMGIHFLDKRPMVSENLYFEYDMPTFLSYTVLKPSDDMIKHKGGEGDVHDFIRDRVIRFNVRNRDDARIFSSSLNGANFSTAFELKDTIKIFDLDKYSEKILTGAMVHMRWPTSQGNGIWWGAQPIVHGNLIGIHNGHLSSDKSNARALEQLGIPMQVGTDSEAIFQETHYLLKKGLSLDEIEWVMSQKFPPEIIDLPDDKKHRYSELTLDPVLRHFKMSGPSTAVINYGDIMIGMTDRDHMRQFTVGYNDSSAVFASEERAIVTYMSITKTPLTILSPPAGKLIGFLAKWNNNIRHGIDSVQRLNESYIHFPELRETPVQRT